MLVRRILGPEDYVSSPSALFLSGVKGIVRGSYYPHANVEVLILFTPDYGSKYPYRELKANYASFWLGYLSPLQQAF